VTYLMRQGWSHHLCCSWPEHSPRTTSRRATQDIVFAQQRRWHSQAR